MSVAQLFSNHTADLAPYVDGRFFLANSAILCRYIDGADFATRGIYNELKLAKRTDADVLDATAVYLAGIYLHALFYIMEQGGIVSQLKLSYPDKSYQLELSSRWETAGNIVNRCFAVGSPIALTCKHTRLNSGRKQMQPTVILMECRQTLWSILAAAQQTSR